jgi:pilus assembly protein Flp/PilA
MSGPIIQIIIHVMDNQFIMTTDNFGQYLFNYVDYSAQQFDGPSALLTVVQWRVTTVDFGFRPAGISLLPTSRSDGGGRHAKELTNMEILARFAMDESAAAAIEYGLIAALISVAIITILGSVGARLTTTFQSVSTALR